MEKLFFDNPDKTYVVPEIRFQNELYLIKKT